jgi:hypothetical protein
MAAVRFDTLRSVAFGDITNSYTALGSALTQNWRMFRVVNKTDADMLISFNASTNNLIVPANSFVLYDLSTNALNVQDSDWFVMQIGTQFSIKYVTAPTSGNVYVEGIYSTGV